MSTSTPVLSTQAIAEKVRGRLTTISGQLDSANRCIYRELLALCLDADSGSAKPLERFLEFEAKLKASFTQAFCKKNKGVSWAKADRIFDNGVRAELRSWLRFRNGKHSVTKLPKTFEGLKTQNRRFSAQYNKGENSVESFGVFVNENQTFKREKPLSKAKAEKIAKDKRDKSKEEYKAKVVAEQAKPEPKTASVPKGTSQRKNFEALLANMTEKQSNMYLEHFSSIMLTDQAELEKAKKTAKKTAPKIGDKVPTSGKGINARLEL